MAGWSLFTAEFGALVAELDGPASEAIPDAAVFVMRKKRNANERTVENDRRVISTPVVCAWP